MGYRVKAIVSGVNIEIYEYENVVLSGYKDTKHLGSRGRQGVANEEDRVRNRIKVATRARNDLVRKINSNYSKGSSRFITLTFKENITDLQVANYEFNKFIKRFEYYLGFKTKYTAVVEFQKRGAVHYHCVFYNLAKKLNLIECMKIWGQGSFNCKRIDRVSNVGAYMVKYMSKNSDDERLYGQKMYFNSRNLKKPLEIKEPDKVKSLLEKLQNRVPSYSSSYDIVYNGKSSNTVFYRQYVLE